MDFLGGCMTRIIGFVVIYAVIFFFDWGCQSAHDAIYSPDGKLYSAQSTVQDAEENRYATVTLGSREWMAANLNTTRFRDGSTIAEATSYEAWVNACSKKQPAWAWIDMNQNKGKSYGRIYNWYAINDPRGLAPEGWSIPDSTDWMDLTSAANLEAVICHYDAGDVDIDGDFDARVLQIENQEWDNPDGFGWDRSGTNETGFSALPGGLIDTDGKPVSLEQETLWWGRDGMVLRIGNHSHGNAHDVAAFYHFKGTHFGAYVRCVRTR